jgi:hypothetical protein
MNRLDLSALTDWDPLELVNDSTVIFIYILELQ